MKYISLITGSDLRMVMGVNHYLDSFIRCNGFFDEVRVNRIYSGFQTLKVDEGEEMPIGSDIGTTEYKIRRGLRTFLRNLLTNKFYPFEKFRYETNLYRVSKNAIKRFLKDSAPCDFIIFEERGVAEYYFKNRIDQRVAKNIATFLVVHSEGDNRLSIPLRYSNRINDKIKQEFYRRRDFVYSHVDKVIYISQKAYNNSFLPENKRAYVYNGASFIDYSFHFDSNQIKQFVCVGNFNGGKGQDKIIEAMTLLPNTTLERMHMTFVGGGQDYEIIKSQVRLNGLDKYVTFLGVRNDVPEVLEGMDVFIMPSLTEGLSMSAIEAMRAGLYLVLTDTGGNNELCDDGCGIICTRDPQNIAKIVSIIVEGNFINKAQKEHSHLRFRKLFSTESMARGYEDTLLSL